MTSVTYRYAEETRLHNEGGALYYDAPGIPKGVTDAGLEMMISEHDEGEPLPESETWYKNVLKRS